MALVVVASVAPRGQQEVTDADLAAASGGRTIRVGTLANGRVTAVALETYVARVLAGEGEPRAPEAAQQALAVAIRTFAAANAARHRRDGFDLCDSTHCQVLRASTADARRAAISTAGRLLMWNGRPAEVFYSASCGGHSERAEDVWPGANLPYLVALPDDVHDEDRPWAVDIPLQTIRQALRRIGFEGDRLREVTVEERSASGRVTRLRLAGLRPDVISGNRFRLAIGASELRSTAFQLDPRGTVVRFTGRGYGHGVGMCVVGAGRRALRGESVDAILAKYCPGLELTAGRERRP